MSNINLNPSTVPQKLSSQDQVQQVVVKDTPKVIETTKIMPSPELFQEPSLSSPELTGDITQQMISSLIDSHTIDQSLKVPQPMDLEAISQLREDIGVQAQEALRTLTGSRLENDVQDLLFNPDKKVAFSDFAIRESTGESIAFLDGLKAVLEEAPPEAKALLALYKEFMAPDAPQLINLPGDRFSSLNTAFKLMSKARHKGSETEQLKAMSQMLQEVSKAGKEISLMLSRDTYGRFINSDHMNNMDFYAASVHLSETPGELKAFATLDNSQDRFVRENSLKIYRNEHMKDLNALYSNLLGSQQHLERQAQDLIALFPERKELKGHMDKIQALDQTLGKLMISLGQALGKNDRETVELKHKTIQKLQAKLTQELEQLNEMVPTFTEGDKAVKRFVELKQASLDLKVQRSYLDMFMNVKGLGEVGVQFFASDDMNFLGQQGLHDQFTQVEGVSREIRLFNKFDTDLVITESNLGNVINEIIGIKPDLSTNEGYEKFYNDVLNRNAFATMDHKLRGSFLQALFKAGIANVGLVQDFLLNNARNMTEEPDLTFLKKPLVQKSANFQVYKQSILGAHLGRLKGFIAASATAEVWNSKGIDLSAVQDDSGKLELQKFGKLKEALTDRHAGSNILLDYNSKKTYIQKLKQQNIDVSLLEGSEGDANIRTLLSAFATGSLEDLRQDNFDLFLLGREAVLKNNSSETNLVSMAIHFPLFALYHQIQGSEDRELLLSSLKEPVVPDLSAVLNSKGGLDQHKVGLLLQAVEGDQEVLANDEPLQALQRQLTAFFGESLSDLEGLLANIPRNDDQIAEQLLAEYTDAYTLKAYEPLLKARSENPDFDAYLKFTDGLKTEAAVKGYSEGGHLSRFTELSNKLDVPLFESLQTLKQEPNLETRKNLTEELLEKFQFKRAQDELQDFFMGHILRYAAEDREEREERSSESLDNKI